MKHGLRSLRNSGALKVRDLYRANVFDLKVIPGRSGRDETTERFTTSIDQLYEFMANGGKVPPIKIQVDDQTGDVVVVQGHRRRLAYLRLIPELQEKARAAGVDEKKVEDLAFIECMPFEGNDVDVLAEVSAGNESLPLTDVEAGRNYLQLQALGLSVDAICKKVGANRSTVEARMTIAGANHDLQQQVTDGTIKPTAAAAAVKKHGSKAGAVVAAAKEASVAKGGKGRVTGAAVAAKKKPDYKELLAAAEELFGMYKEVETFRRLGAAIEGCK